MNRLKLFLCATALIASTTFAQTTLTPGTVSYTIEQNGKKLGTASYTIENAPNKYLITSNGKITQDKFSYAFSNTQKVDTVPQPHHRPAQRRRQRQGRQFQRHLGPHGPPVQA